jgi:hypothetical protein
MIYTYSYIRGRLSHVEFLQDLLRESNEHAKADAKKECYRIMPKHILQALDAYPELKAKVENSSTNLTVNTEAHIHVETDIYNRHDHGITRH